jgi:3-oxoacyl-[acyl-carrier-protein] synthase II
LDDPLDEGKGVNLVPIDAQVKKIDLAVNNGFGFGGINSTTVFAMPED